MCRVGQNRIYTPYMTVYSVISLPKLSYIHRIYMVLANPVIVLSLGFLCRGNSRRPRALWKNCVRHSQSKQTTCKLRYVYDYMTHARQYVYICVCVCVSM